jgi:23S rRNA pseudouridine2605 synthase
LSSMSNEERLQKIIAAAGIASRRKAEILIKEGRVSINGKVVTKLGSKADPARDHIRVDGTLVRKFPDKVYILLNKPRGVISSVADPEGRVKVTDLVDVKQKLYPVGRLDFNTEGLILLTNDGEFAKIVSAAGAGLPKVYHVKVRSAPEQAVLKKLCGGIRLRRGTQLAGCRIVPIKEGNNTWLEVTLLQGKNRQIREMFEQVGHPVMKLRRKRIGFLTDDGLASGQYRFLTESEVGRVLKKGTKTRSGATAEG